MRVSDAVASRRSVRSFLDTPVSDDLIRDLLIKAARAPSGGNLQPWRIHVVNGTGMRRFMEHLAGYSGPEEPEYDIYPPSLKEPYRTSRFKVGEDMYALLGIGREDRAGRYAHVEKNFEFFGAPSGLFCYIDRLMGRPQWSDLGMFLQTFMLLAREAGLDTCAQEAWSLRPRAVAAFLEPAEDLLLFCGMAIGHGDPEAAVNRLMSEREPLNSWATFHS